MSKAKQPAESKPNAPSKKPPKSPFTPLKQDVHDPVAEADHKRIVEELYSLDGADPKNPGDFSDIASLDAGSSSKSERYTLEDLCGFRQLEFDGKIFLVRHPKIRERLEISRRIQLITRADAARKKSGSGEEPDDYALSDRLMIQEIYSILPVLFIPDDNGAPVPCPIDYAMDHLDIPDIHTISNLMKPRSAVEVVEDAGLDSGN